jgi:hypothetical protein
MDNIDILLHSIIAISILAVFGGVIWSITTITALIKELIKDGLDGCKDIEES